MGAKFLVSPVVIVFYKNKINANKADTFPVAKLNDLVDRQQFSVIAQFVVKFHEKNGIVHLTTFIPVCSTLPIWVSHCNFNVFYDHVPSFMLCVIKMAFEIKKFLIQRKKHTKKKTVPPK